VGERLYNHNCKNLVLIEKFKAVIVLRHHFKRKNICQDTQILDLDIHLMNNQTHRSTISSLVSKGQKPRYA
jgi:hypothetical protein